MVTGLASSSLTVSFSATSADEAAAAVGAAVLRDRPPYPPDEAEGLEKRLLGLAASVVGVSEVDGRFCERNLKRLRPSSR